MDTSRPLMLFMQGMASKYSLWINGDYIQGSITDDLSLYNSALIPVSTGNGVIEIVLHVKNFENLRGGLAP